MTETPGHLDSLISETFSGLQLVSVTVRSVTGSPGASSSAAPGSIAVAITGLPAESTSLSDALTIVAVDDTADTVTFSDVSYGQPARDFTNYVIGYSTAAAGTTVNSYLLSTQPANTIDQLLNQDQYAAAAASLAVLSFGILFPIDTAAFAPSATPVPSPGISVLDTSVAQTVIPEAEPYLGSLAGLKNQWCDITPDSLNVTVSAPGWFIHSGGGTDAIAASSGTNVLDGGTGSNFLTGGSGADTFFLDDRGATANIWSTLVNFHSSDTATVWGVSPADFSLKWIESAGAAGYTGLTLTASAPNRPIALVTLAGFSQADLSNGRLSVTFGVDAASGANYMLIHGN